jgi:hypothetical protein
MTLSLFSTVHDPEIGDVGLQFADEAALRHATDPARAFHVGWDSPTIAADGTFIAAVFTAHAAEGAAAGPRKCHSSDGTRETPSRILTSTACDRKAHLEMRTACSRILITAVGDPDSSHLLMGEGKG